MVFVISPSTGVAVLVIIAFFVVGGLLLTRVDLDEGRRRARAAESVVTTVETAGS